MFTFGLRSQTNLTGVHPDLVKLMWECITNAPHDFTITEGLRSSTRQQRLVDEGKSKTLNSRHITGHAVDIAIIKDGKAIWDVQPFEEVIVHIEQVASSLNIPIVCGGRWKSFPDWPHIELDRKVYK